MIRKITGQVVDTIKAITTIGGEVTSLELSYSKPALSLENETIKIKYEEPKIIAIRCYWHDNQYRLGVGGWGEAVFIELVDNGMLVSPDEAFEDGIMRELKKIQQL